VLHNKNILTCLPIFTFAFDFTFIQTVNFLSQITGKNAGLGQSLTMPCPKQAPAVPFKDLEVKRTDIVVGERLGAGNFTEVHAGRQLCGLYTRVGQAAQWQTEGHMATLI